MLAKVFFRKGDPLKPAPATNSGGPYIFGHNPPADRGREVF